MTAWTLFICASCAYGAAGSLLLFRIPLCGKGNAFRGKVSVVIPARNEEERLPRLLSSLARERELLKDSVNLEVIVADDESTDSTADTAASFGCEVVPAFTAGGEGTETEGAAGKSRACWSGASRASGDYLLFLDADTEFETGGLSRVLESYGGGLLSVQPYHRKERLYETLSSFFNIVVMAGVGAFTPFSKPGKPFGCFGPCLLCRRDDYLSTGGHAAIMDKLVDDIALARLFLKNGFPVHCRGGRKSVSFRMYPGGLRDLVEGWTKNMSTASGMSAPVTNVLLFIWIAGMANLFLAAGRVFAECSPLTAGITAGVYVLYVLQVFWHLRRVGNRPLLPALLFPAYMAFFIGLFFYSVFRTRIMKTVTWRGRTIRLKQGKGS